VNLTDSTHAAITFTADDNPSYAYLFGDGGSVAVNVNASSFAYSGLTFSNKYAGFTAATLNGTSSGNEDGLGSYNLKFDFHDGYTQANTSIAFTLTNQSGTWATAANVLTLNGSNYAAAAHIFVATVPVSASGGTAANPATGFAAALAGPGSPPPPIATPLPTIPAMAVILTGLSACGARRWCHRAV
jgi:hypothetical protein